MQIRTINSLLLTGVLFCSINQLAWCGDSAKLLSKKVNTGSWAGTPMMLVAPLFVQDQSTNSVITLVNASPKPINLQIQVSALSGEVLARQITVLDGHSQSKLSVEELLVSSGSVPLARGSITIVSDRLTALAGQLSLSGTNTTSPFDIEEEFVMMPMNAASAHYRAVTAGLSISPLLAIHNVGSSEQVVTVSCAGIMQGKPQVQISPGRTVLIETCTGQPVAEGSSLVENWPTSNNRFTVNGALGVTVDASSDASRLAVFGIGVHKRGEIFALPFWSINDLTSGAAVYPGAFSALPGIVPSKLVLDAATANFSDLPRSATILIDSDAGESQLAELSIPPHGVSSKSLELSGSAYKNASIRIKSDASPGELATDIQTTFDYGSSKLALTPPAKIEGNGLNGGEHPWALDGTTDSTLLLFNPDLTASSSVHIQIYSSSLTWSKTVLLSPSSTRSFSIRDLIASQALDDSGQALPASLSSGILVWSTLANPVVYGKLVQSDTTTRVLREYACGITNAICGQPQMQDSGDGATHVSAVVGVNVGSVPNCFINQGSCGCLDYCGDAGTGGYSDAQWSTDGAFLSEGPPPGDWQFYAQGSATGLGAVNVILSDNNGCYAYGQDAITVNPEITLNSLGDVTNGNPSLVVGQLGNFFAHLGNGPLTLVSQSWSFAGPTVSSYNIASDSSSASTYPVNLNTQNPYVYWYGLPTNTSQNQSVTYRATMSDGNTYTASTAVNVITPGVNMSVTAQPSSAIGLDSTDTLSYGDPSSRQTSGMYMIVNSLSNTNGINYSLAWAQLITADNTTLLDSGTQVYSSSTTGLDESYPYNDAGYMTDTPGFGPVCTSAPCNNFNDIYYTEVKRSGTFQSYLMFTPQGDYSIPVPLKVVTWSYNFDIPFDQTGCGWCATVAQGASPAIADATSFPVWTNKVSNGPPGEEDSRPSPDDAVSTAKRRSR